jgi:hypothetical protein
MEKKGGFLSSNPYNETGKSDTPEMTPPYFTWNDVLSHHGSTQGADMTGSANTRSGDDIMGGPAKGEPDLPKK